MDAHEFGLGNQEGARILKLCQSKELRMINTMFKKGRKKEITYKSRGAEKQIYFILLKARGISVRDGI